MSVMTDAVEAMERAGRVIDQLVKQNDQFRAALEGWYEDWDSRYDGAPLKEYEIRMLKVLGRRE